MAADHQVRREMSDLEARYEAINRAWRESGIPAFVLQTPNWQSGWQALLDWLKPYDIRSRDPEAWESIIANSRPSAKTTWENEIHIFSHFHSPVSGHCLEHVTIEEEGTRAILAWWQERSAQALNASL